MEDDHMITIAELSEAKARIEELKLEVRDAVKQGVEWEQDTHNLMAKSAKQEARIEKIEAKNARFKAALRKISVANLAHPPPIDHLFRFVVMVAREALKGTADEG